MSIYEKEDTSNKAETLTIVSSKDNKKIFRGRIVKALVIAAVSLYSAISNHNKKASNTFEILVMIGTVIYAGWAVKKRIDGNSNQKIKIK